MDVAHVDVAAAEGSGQGPRSAQKTKTAAVKPATASVEKKQTGEVRLLVAGGGSDDHQLLRLRELDNAHNTTNGRVLQGKCSVCRKRKTSFYCSCTPRSAFEVPSGSSKRKRGGIVFLCVDGACPGNHRNSALPINPENPTPTPTPVKVEVPLLPLPSVPEPETAKIATTS